VAIIPAIEYPRIVSAGVELAILPDLAIASKERVRSLLVVAKKPIAQVRSIALDRSSRSTQALVKILCARQWGIAPEFVEAEPELQAMLQSNDAALVIGDVALRIAIAAERKIAHGMRSEWIVRGREIGTGGGEKVYIYDVVKEWWHLTELPAVLAVWAARKELATPELVADFVDSRNLGMEHTGEICAEAAREMVLPEEELRLYLEKNIDYTLDEENLRGLERFWALSSAQRLIGEMPPTAIASSQKSPVRFKDKDYVVAKKHA
jgi:chorismate dehydratase